MTNRPDMSKPLLALYGVIVLACLGWHLWRPWERKPLPPPSPAQRAWADIERANRPADLRCDASYYAWPEHGRPTASGERFDSTALTCAIYGGFLRLAPYGSTLLVRNATNGKVVLVKVTDNMPSCYAKQGRMLDLSKAAAETLGMVEAGVANVECWKLTPASGREKRGGTDGYL